MFKYFHIIKFLMTHDLTELKKFWKSEVIQDENKSFKWTRLIRNYIKKSSNNNLCYWFWWRLASETYKKGNTKQKESASKINKRLIAKYGPEIGLSANIGLNPYIHHFAGIVITHYATIGNYLQIKQNTTIGIKDYGCTIIIGNNVHVGAHTCILGTNNKIGDNVKIGAMCFINSDIPDNCTVITEKTNRIILKPNL